MCILFLEDKNSPIYNEQQEPMISEKTNKKGMFLKHMPIDYCVIMSRFEGKKIYFEVVVKK